MMKFVAFTITLLCLTTGYLGWLFAHAAVADECRKLGTFYVGATTYQCKAKENNDADR